MRFDTSGQSRTAPEALLSTSPLWPRRLAADPRRLTVESFSLGDEPEGLMHDAPLLNGEAAHADD
ncbi:hypothetical protein EAH88_16285 [Rhodanobacter glycinis]|uniref:Uncharacterized protein n=1 Tax=Rhodanobacter glycinis TaxID=582702 RepID=A0A502BWP2_9GAMM|nr:hypothetical protein EAH88_16285 [Rhodanobacter glycinis]